MRRTFIAVFIWALIQATSCNCTQCNNNNNSDIDKLAPVPRSGPWLLFFRLWSCLIIHPRFVAKKWRSSRGSWILWVIRWTLICGLFATLLTTSALHFLRPNVIWLAVSVSVSMTLWLALRSAPDPQHLPPTVEPPSPSLWHLKRNELHAQR